VNKEGSIAKQQQQGDKESLGLYRLYGRRRLDNQELLEFERTVGPVRNVGSISKGRKELACSVLMIRVL